MDHVREILGFSFSFERGQWYALFDTVEVTGEIDTTVTPYRLRYGCNEFADPNELIDYLCSIDSAELGGCDD